MLILSAMLVLLALINIAAISFVISVVRQELTMNRLTRSGTFVAFLSITVLMLSTLVCSYGAFDALRG